MLPYTLSVSVCLSLSKTHHHHGWFVAQRNFRILTKLRVLPWTVTILSVSSHQFPRQMCVQLTRHNLLNTPSSSQQVIGIFLRPPLKSYAICRDILLYRSFLLLRTQHAPLHLLKVYTTHSLSATAVLSTAPGRQSQGSFTYSSHSSVSLLRWWSALSCYQYQRGGDTEPVPPVGPREISESTKHLVQLFCTWS